MRVDAGQSFNFLPLPTDVHVGCGCVTTLADRLRALGATRALVVTDPGVRAAGIVDRVVAGLERDHLPFAIYDNVTADSGSRLICQGVDARKTHTADVVVGLGGGSALDTAKAIAALSTNPGSPLEYLGLHKLRQPPIPIVAIPTTAGTGSEVSLWSVFTDDDRALKVAIGSVWLYPALALCDPDLTLDLPAALTASTGMDALAHAIECYTNKACQPISGALALEAIRLIGLHLRRAVRDNRDPESRYAMLVASTMAGMAMNPTRLGLAHALAMPLGSWDLKIPHSVAIAVTLPEVMAFNRTAAPERFVAVARALDEGVDQCSVDEGATLAAYAVRRLGDDIGIPSSLAQYGLREEHIVPVVDEAMKSGNVAVNPRPTTHEQLAGILRRVL